MLQVGPRTHVSAAFQGPVPSKKPLLLPLASKKAELVAADGLVAISGVQAVNELGTAGAMGEDAILERASEGGERRVDGHVG